MKPRVQDPRRLDVERFASDGGHLEGHWPLTGMLRLVEACHAEALPASADLVEWKASGERRRQDQAGSQAWLRLTLDTQVNLVCQRCLGPLATPLQVDRWFHFVVGEEQAAALDAESDEDVLASTRTLDLMALAEDELLLALPLVPRHDDCPKPLLPVATDALAVDARADPDVHPFAALAVLRRRPH